MKVTDKREHVQFKDIAVGECFEYDGGVFIKTKAVHVDVGDASFVGYKNSVDLDNGCFYCLSEGDVVTKLDTELIIK